MTRPSRRSKHPPADAPDSRDAFCPSCERFIGPADVCPYCDCDSARSPWWRHLRLVALCLAVGGLVLLHAAAQRQVPERVEIRCVGPAMQYGWVRIEGTLVERPLMRQESEAAAYVAFWVDDGTGRIRVWAEGPVAAELYRDGRLNRTGSRLDITGMVGMGRDRRPRIQVLHDAHLAPAITRDKSPGSP